LRERGFDVILYFLQAFLWIVDGVRINKIDIWYISEFGLRGIVFLRIAMFDGGL